MVEVDGILNEDRNVAVDVVTQIGGWWLPRLQNSQKGVIYTNMDRCDPSTLARPMKRMKSRGEEGGGEKRLAVS